MRSLSSEETRRSLLAEVGVATPRSYEDDGPMEVQEQSTDVEVETSEEEEEKEEEVKSLLDFTKSKHPDPEEQSEIDRLRQQMSEMNSRLEASVSKAEKEIKEEEEETFEDIDWTSPAIVKVFAEELNMDEEEAAKFAKISGNLATVVTQSTIGRKVEKLESKLSQEELKKKHDAAYERSWNNLQMGMRDAREKGGLEAEVVEEFEILKEKSSFGDYFIRHPEVVSSKESVTRAIMSIAREAELNGVVPSKRNEIIGSREEVTGTLSKARTETAQHKENKQKMTPEEEIRAAIMNASQGGISKLPKGFR